MPEHNYAKAELLYNKLMEPALRAAIASLPLPRNNGRILDAGCGPGGVFPLLCKALGPTGQLVGIDFSEPHFAKAKEQIGKESSHKNVRIEKVNLMEPLPFPENHFDAVWAADVILPDDFVDTVDVVKRLVRVLCPGGILAIFYGNWLRPIFLPGYARLEHLICVAKELMYARDRRWDGHIHPERAELWLRQAGLTATRMDFFPVHYRQPLPNHVYEYVSRYSLREFYGNAIRQYGDAVSLTAEDKVLWERLRPCKSGVYSRSTGLLLCCFRSAHGWTKADLQTVRWERKRDTTTIRRRAKEAEIKEGSAHETAYIAR